MKPLSRRSLFGAAAGAAVAGPAAVKSVLESSSLKSAGIGTVGMVDMGAKTLRGFQETTPAEDPNWLSRQLTNLVSERAEFLKRSEMPATGACSTRHAIDGLRSVSAANRSRMLEEDAWRRNRDSHLSWLDERIADAKKQLGIIGYLV